MALILYGGSGGELEGKAGAAAAPGAAQAKGGAFGFSLISKVPHESGISSGAGRRARRPPLMATWARRSPRWCAPA